MLTYVSKRLRTIRALSLPLDSVTYKINLNTKTIPLTMLCRPQNTLITRRGAPPTDGVIDQNKPKIRPLGTQEDTVSRLPSNTE